MDWKTFIASVVDSLAWPGAIIAIIFILRKHIVDLFPFLKKLKYKDFELEFSKSILELKSRTQDIAFAVPDDTEERLLPDMHERLLALADVSPRSAILESWLLVESAAADVIRRTDIASFKSWPGPMRIGQYLRKGEILSAEQLEVYEQLRYLRNQAVHVVDTVFRTGEVFDYVDMAVSLARHLEKKR